jgi:hypothetical protein
MAALSLGRLEALLEKTVTAYHGVERGNARTGQEDWFRE